MYSRKCRRGSVCCDLVEAARCVWGAETGKQVGLQVCFYNTFAPNLEGRCIGKADFVSQHQKDLAHWLYLVSHLFTCDVTLCFKTRENRFLWIDFFCFKQTFELFCPHVRDVCKATVSETSVGPTQLSCLSLTPAVSLAYIIAQLLPSSKKCTNTYWKISFLFFLPCAGSERTDSFIP